jgi:uncharacterized protein (TIGR02265 family)
MKYVAIESLLYGFDIKEGSPVMEQVKSICNLHATSNLAEKDVPVEQYIELVQWLASRYYSHLPLSKGLFEVGMRWYEGYRKTILGKVQLAAIHIIGPERTLKKVPAYAEKHSNFGKRNLVQQGPQSYILQFREIPLAPDFVIGILKGGFVECGIEKVSLEWKRLGPEDLDFIISW